MKGAEGDPVGENERETASAVEGIEENDRGRKREAREARWSKGEGQRKREGNRKEEETGVFQRCFQREGSRGPLQAGG